MARPKYGIYQHLPISDSFGNYWFRTDKKDVLCVAIMPRKGNKKSEAVAPYMISLGMHGIVWNGTFIREFPNAALALHHLHEIIDAGKLLNVVLDTPV